MQINAKRKKTGQEISVDVEIPTDLKGLVSQYGEETVYSHAKGSLVVALQGYMRGQLDRGKSQEEIAQGVANWKPGQRKPGKSPQEKAREAMSQLPPEVRAQLIKEFRATQKAA